MKPLVALLLCSFAAAQSSGGSSEETVAAQFGTLEILSEQPDVEIRVNGQPRGTAPLRLEDIGLATYDLEAEKAGYRVWRGQATVEAGKVTTVRVVLERLPGEATAAAEAGDEFASFVDRIEPGVFLGTHVFSSDSELGTLGKPDTQLDLGLALGVRLALAVTVLLDAEGEVALIPTSFDPGPAAMVFGLRLHGLLHFTGRSTRLRPFLLAGWHSQNVLTDEVPNVISARDSDPGAHWGLGAKLAITSALSLRLDFRHLIVGDRGTGATNELEVLAGLCLHFGREPAAPAAQPAPAPAPPVSDDRDGDGLLGSRDACPEQAEDRDSFQDQDGCPDPDNDADGVRDEQDQCGDQAETRNGYKDDDGCADELPREVAKFTGVIKGITFKKGSAQVQRKSFKTLDATVEVLAKYEALRIEVSGHTSAEGNREANVTLSRKRAEAVRDYFVSKGIAPERLTAVGHGPDRPISENKSRRGRERNRRIEFRLQSE